jgi:hypothetical protein
MFPIDQYFQPFGTRWLRHLVWRFGQTTDVRMPRPYRACLDCGLVWNELSPEKLRKIIEREGIAVGDEEILTASYPAMWHDGDDNPSNH